MAGEPPTSRPDPCELLLAEASGRALIEAAPDAAIIVDAAGIITVVNELTARMFGYDIAEMVGMPLAQLIPERLRGEHADHVAAYLRKPGTRPMGTGLKIVGVRKDRSELALDIALSPVETRQGQMVWALIRDISQQVSTLAARDRLIDELESALANTRTLNGMVPICANCKRIRDEVGTWHMLEAYIQEHTSALFSHGICPACSEKLYPVDED